MTTTAARRTKLQAGAVDVTAVLADIAIAESIRAQMKGLEKTLKEHETAIKDVLDGAEVGIDAKGKTVVRQPVRNRTDLIKELVKAKMDPTDYAECEHVSSYRVLLYGE